MAAAKKAPKANGAPAGRENIMRQQLRALAAIDDGVGQLLNAREEIKQLDQTCVVFTSDNGYFWGELGLGDKRWAYEESIRDPLLMRYPKLIKAGTTLDPLALNVDIAPTVLELAGELIAKSIQGRSLLPLFTDAKAPWRSSILSEYFQEGQNRTPDWQAARTDRRKYIHHPTLGGMDELYDLRADRYELKNLIKDPAAQSALKQMQAELAKLRQETGAQ